ncbi:MAG: hypothetical protein IJ424_01830 [Oscillospiraceae bacterium]|nr:hypothetical protein [Oscillospiraceae bacterium]
MLYRKQLFSVAHAQNKTQLFNFFKFNIFIWLKNSHFSVSRTTNTRQFGNGIFVKNAQKVVDESTSKKRKKPPSFDSTVLKMIKFLNVRLTQIKDCNTYQTMHSEKLQQADSTPHAWF